MTAAPKEDVAADAGMVVDVLEVALVDPTVVVVGDGCPNREEREVDVEPPRGTAAIVVEENLDPDWLVVGRKLDMVCVES